MSKLIDRIQDIYYPIIGRIERKYDNLRARCQRFKRGYSYGDVYDMDYWFIRTARPMLVHLRDNGRSYPGIFKDGDEWRQVLSEMINCLDFMDEDNVYNHLGFIEFEDIMCMTVDDFKHVDEIMDQNKDRFFELFSKYFYNLWD